MTSNFKWIFFGSAEFSVFVLDELARQGLLPNLIVTVPDKPKGRRLILTPNPVKTWAEERKIEVLTPPSLKDNPDLVSKLYTVEPDIFLVAAYGKLIPKEVFNIPKKETLNIHPSLLPKYRGASPIESQILNDEEEMGVSIMQIDEGMDTGPVVAQRKTASVLDKTQLEKLLAEEGARLFAEILPEWLQGKIQTKAQDGEKATITKKIKKEDGLLDLEADARVNFLKIKAFQGWPGTYFILNNRRVIVTDAEIENSKLKILKVIPEGKKEMPYQDFLRGLRK